MDTFYCLERCYFKCFYVSLILPVGTNVPSDDETRKRSVTVVVIKTT
jgi:hypothetical protein